MYGSRSDGREINPKQKKASKEVKGFKKQQVLD
jgi:hypothetical protein